jgi:type IX secretion system PorP/SprF family membrane protein
MKQTLQAVAFRKVSVLASLMLFSMNALAQQDPLYGLWLNNPLVINPAYTGINNDLVVFATYRSQWAGFDGSPTTMTAGGHSSLLRNKIGAGFMVVNDKIGENTNTQLMGTFAYKLLIKTGTTLSFGMSGGFINYKTDPSQLTLQDPTDPLFAPVSQLKPSIGAGVMLKSDKYLLGLSIPRLINGSFDMGGQKIDVYQQHFYLLGSYLFHLSERLTLKPSLLLKYVNGSPLSADINVNLILNTNYTVGLYARNLNAYGLMAQVTFLDKFRLAYALEVPANSSVGAQFITNEVMISMRTPVLRFHERSVSNF